MLFVFVMVQQNDTVSVDISVLQAKLNAQWATYSLQHATPNNTSYLHNIPQLSSGQTIIFNIGNTDELQQSSVQNVPNDSVLQHLRMESSVMQGGTANESHHLRPSRCLYKHLLLQSSQCQRLRCPSGLVSSPDEYHCNRRHHDAAGIMHWQQQLTTTGISLVKTHKFISFGM